MRIAFMGTPAFAACALQRLYDDGHDVCCVFTQPDKPRDRGMKVACCPAKELAGAHGTLIVQPATLRDGQALELLRSLRPELIAVVAYGKLLPPEILDLPPLGCVNIHGSLLPKYRGSAPIQRAVLNGEAETGVTSMYMAPEMDTGDIILVKKTTIGPDETSGELFSRLGTLGAELLGETVRGHRQRNSRPHPAKRGRSDLRPASHEGHEPHRLDEPGTEYNQSGPGPQSLACGDGLPRRRFDENF